MADPSALIGYVGDFSSNFPVALSLDVLIIGGVFGFFFLYAFRFGKGRMASLIFSFYIAYVLYLLFPYTEQLTLFKDTPGQIVLSHIGIFAIFLVIAGILLNRLVSFHDDFGGRKWFASLVLAGLATALLFTFGYQVIPITDLYRFSIPSLLLFARPELFFWWLLLPLIGIFFLTRR